MPERSAAGASKRNTPLLRGGRTPCILLTLKHKGFRAVNARAMFPRSLPSRCCTDPALEPQVLHQQPSFSCRLLVTGLLALAGGPALSQQVTPIDGAAHYPEGPLWRADKLVYVEYSAGNIKTWNGARTDVFWHRDGCGPSGAIARGSDLLIACYDGNYLVELDAAGREVQVLRKDSVGQPFSGPNDFAADDHGGIYFSASGAYDIKAPITGTVLYLHADSTVTQVATTVHYPNGLTVTKDRHHLLVAEMLAGRLLSFPIAADGTLGERTVWARMQDLAPPTPNADAYN